MVYLVLSGNKNRRYELKKLSSNLQAKKKNGHIGSGLVLYFIGLVAYLNGGVHIGEETVKTSENILRTRNR